MNVSDGKEYPLLIDGYHVKQLICKNDDCRALIGYENIKVGVLIYRCPRCKYLSTWHIGYKDAADTFFAKLQKKFENKKGGE